MAVFEPCIACFGRAEGPARVKAFAMPTAEVAAGEGEEPVGRGDLSVGGGGSLKGRCSLDAECGLARESFRFVMCVLGIGAVCGAGWTCRRLI